VVVPPAMLLTNQIGFARTAPFTVALNCSDCSGTKSAEAGVIIAFRTEPPASASGAKLPALHPEMKPIMARRPLETRICTVSRFNFPLEARFQEVKSGHTQMGPRGIAAFAAWQQKYKDFGGPRRSGKQSQVSHEDLDLQIKICTWDVKICHRGSSYSCGIVSLEPLWSIPA
jgi:hypothetical protein